MPKSPYEPPPLPEGLKDLPPLVARGLHGLGYRSLDEAHATMRRLSRTFVNMSNAKHGEFASLNGTHSNVRMTEKHFALFALFAAVGFEVISNPPATSRDLPALPALPALPGPNSKQLKIPGS